MKNLALLLILFTGNLFAQNSEEITLEIDKGTISGTLLCPKPADKIPIVLIISGSGPTDRDGNNPMMKNNSLKMLAEGLLKKGIASVRYDKRGIGKSANISIKENEFRFENYVNDAKAWVDKLKKDQRFSEIIILGHSEGSTIGMIAAQKPAVGKFISLAGPSEKASDMIREQLKNQPKFVLDQSLPILEKLEKGDTVSSISPMLMTLFRPSVQPYMISWFKYDPKVEIAKLKKPIFIIQGTTDIQVSVENAEKLAKNAKNSKKVAKLIIEGMNHVLKEAEMDRMKNFQTYSNPDLPLKYGLIQGIATFIR